MPIKKAHAQTGPDSDLPPLLALFAVFATETLDAPSCIDQLLLAGKEWMAI